MVAGTSRFFLFGSPGEFAPLVHNASSLPLAGGEMVAFLLASFGIFIFYILSLREKVFIPPTSLLSQ